MLLYEVIMFSMSANKNLKTATGKILFDEIPPRTTPIAAGMSVSAPSLCARH
jgi:hypothetical protein